MEAAWGFVFGSGAQGADTMDFVYGNYAWAVRDGDVGPAPVPEPSTIILLGTGIAGLVGYRRRHRNEQVG